MSKEARIIKACTNGYENRDKFRALAENVIKNDVIPYQGNNKLTKESLDRIAWAMSIDMATGAEFKKMSNIAIGVAIGIVTTVMVVKIVEHIKK